MRIFLLIWGWIRHLNKRPTLFREGCLRTSAHLLNIISLHCPYSSSPVMHHTFSLQGLCNILFVPSLIYWTVHSLPSDYKSCIYHILNLVLCLFFFFPGFYSVPLIFWFLPVPMAWFFLMYYVRLKVELYLVGLFLSFSFIQILRNNRISLSNSIKNSIRTFGCNCIESIDHFGEDWHLLI